MIVTAHQPHYIPWLGYINRIHLADTFVLMDNMEFTKYSYINRNQIRDANGSIMLTIPIKYKGTSKNLIKDIEIDYGSSFKGIAKHSKAIVHNYQSTPGFESFFPAIESIYSKNHKWLLDLNKDLLTAILNYLDIKTKVVLGSDLGVEGNKSDELFIAMLENTQSDTVLLGLGASTKYISPEKIIAKGYNIAKQNFNHPMYGQKGSGNFCKGISTIDLLMNVTKVEAETLVEDSGSIIK